MSNSFIMTESIVRPAKMPYGRLKDNGFVGIEGEHAARALVVETKDDLSAFASVNLIIDDLDCGAMTKTTSGSTTTLSMTLTSSMIGRSGRKICQLIMVNSGNTVVQKSSQFEAYVGRANEIERSVDDGVTIIILSEAVTEMAREAAAAAAEEAVADVVEDCQAIADAASASADAAAQSASDAQTAAASITVDSTLDSTSTHAIQNKAVADALALKADKSTTYTKTEVDQMIEDVEVETDTTLEIAGAPADAAETGRQIGLIKADLGAQVGVFTWANQQYINLTTDPVSLTPISNNVWRYTVVDCAAGDEFVINAVGGNAPRAWGFIDSSNHVLSVATAQATANGLELTAPTNAVKLIINDKSGGISYKVGNNLVSRVGTLEKSGSGLNENAKRALLACVRNVWYTDDSGMSYYEALETALYGGAMPNPMQEIDVALGTISIQPTKIHYTYGTPIRALLNPVLTKCYAGRYKFSLGAYKDGNTYHHQIIVVPLIDPEPTENQLLITDESGERDIWTGTDTDAETVATWSSADYELVLENDAYVFVGFKKLGSVTAFSSTDKTNLKNNYTVTREAYDA